MSKCYLSELWWYEGENGNPLWSDGQRDEGHTVKEVSEEVMPEIYPTSGWMVFPSWPQSLLNRGSCKTLSKDMDINKAMGLKPNKNNIEDFFLTLCL